MTNNCIARFLLLPSSLLEDFCFKVFISSEASLIELFAFLGDICGSVLYVSCFQILYLYILSIIALF